MSISKAFQAAFKRKKEKNWEKIYVIVDIHDTIIRACYDDEETYDYYPLAKEALQLMSVREDICLILWSACYEDKMDAYLKQFADDDIRFDYANCNPEVENTHLSNFDAKFYFNVGIDDKFGFDAKRDWKRVIECLVV